jgi:hypothetical protein
MRLPILAYALSDPRPTSDLNGNITTFSEQRSRPAAKRIDFP